MSQESRRRIAARDRAQHPAEVVIPRFSRGAERVPADLHVGRFSDGHEALPERTGGKEHVGRFADGAA
jgi:hypothetical protein